MNIAIIGIDRNSAYFAIRRLHEDCECVEYNLSNGWVMHSDGTEFWVVSDAEAAMANRYDQIFVATPWAVLTDIERKEALDEIDELIQTVRERLTNRIPEEFQIAIYDVYSGAYLKRAIWLDLRDWREWR